jgi:SAM-dependent methyltransferase
MSDSIFNRSMSTEKRYREYDTWAWLYNKTMGPQYCQNQIQPLETLLLPQLPKGAQILDLCCGTGHLVQQLIRKGYQVTGLDGSEAMLDYARQNAPTAEFILSDARSFDLPPSFDAVFSTSASFNHVLTLEELKQVFRNVYAALRDNGLFLFDINHPGQMEKWWKGRIAEGEIEDNCAWAIAPSYNPEERTGNFQVTIFQAPDGRNTIDSAIQRNLRRLLYKVLSLRRLTRFRLKLLARFQQWEKDWQRSDITYLVRGYSSSEVKLALEAVGFTNVSIQTLGGNSVVDNNRSAYFICRKPHHSSISLTDASTHQQSLNISS